MGMKTKEILKYEHDLRMEELEYIRETERLKHEWKKEQQRIKAAEIRKSHERSANREFASKYSHR